MIVIALQANDHVALRFVVTDALNEAAASDVPAFKCSEIDRAAIFYVNGFGPRFGGDQEQDGGNNTSKHHHLCGREERGSLSNL